MLPQGIDLKTGRELLRLTHNNRTLLNRLAVAQNEANKTAQLRNENIELRQTITGMLNSRSWKITKPLRTLSTAL